MGKGWEKDGKRVCFALFEHLSMCKGHRVNLCNAQSWVLRQIVTKKSLPTQVGYATEHPLEIAGRAVGSPFEDLYKPNLEP